MELEDLYLLLKFLPDNSLHNFLFFDWWQEWNANISLLGSYQSIHRGSEYMDTSLDSPNAAPALMFNEKSLVNWC